VEVGSIPRAHRPPNWATYSAATEAEALARFEEFEEKWAKPYPAISRLWRNAWSEFVPFLDYDVEIRKIICSTNAIESINARYRRAVRARGHFPSDQAALKCLYLVTRSLDPTGKGQGTMGDEVEACPERIRHHLRRPDQPGRKLIMRPDQIHRLSDTSS
jgi:transposase-like protein